MNNPSTITVDLEFYFDPISTLIDQNETVCVAGEFTNPPWQIWIPMSQPSISTLSKNTFYHTRFPYQIQSSQKVLQIPIQYKFVIKERSLWVLGKDLPTATSENNLFTNNVIIPWDFVPNEQKSMISRKSSTSPIQQTSASSSTPESESAPLRRSIPNSKIYASSSSLSSDEDPYVNPLKTDTEYIDKARSENRRKICPSCSIS